MEVQEQVQHLSKRLDDFQAKSNSKYWQLIEEKLSVYLLDELDKKIAAQQSQAMDELLELRLSVLFNKNMQLHDEKLISLQEEVLRLKEKAMIAESKSEQRPQDTKAQDHFRISEKVSRHLERLIEENAEFALKIQQIRQLSVWIASAAGASLLISLMHYAFT